MSATLFVVGDRFAAFAAQTGARTVSQLVSELREGTHYREDDTAVLTLAEGQGVTAYDWDLILDEVKRVGLAGRTRIVPSGRAHLAGRAETHKHREPNVLVADLAQAADATFTAALRVHSDQELQLDHQASHVQGMVVLEAARQMYLAVCERYYGTELPERRYAYVYDRLEATFRNFLFPLDATMTCEVLQSDLSDPELLAFDLQVRFEQAGLSIATVRMIGTAFDRELMERREARSAQRALRHALKQLPEPVVTAGAI